MIKSGSNAILLAVFALLLGCSSVPLDVPKMYSVAREDNRETDFGRDLAGWVALHGDTSGFFPLERGMDALGARLDMAEKAVKSLDLQYFLMKDDTAGRVMLLALLKAADRGVRVRFLLDDIFSSMPDHNLQLINQHPNIEVRLFNPISRRGLRNVNFVANFKRANRRMHNKSFLVDNAVGVIGGRDLPEWPADGSRIYQRSWICRV